MRILSKQMLSVIILMVTLVAVLCAYYDYAVVRDENESGSVMEKYYIEGENRQAILVDKETGVCYLQTNGKNVTAILNADGSPVVRDADFEETFHTYKYTTEAAKADFVKTLKIGIIVFLIAMTLLWLLIPTYDYY